MKKRIRYIFLLMTVCILGIIGFQGYWLYHAYELAHRHFMETVNDALREAVGKKGYNDVKTYSRLHPNLQKDSLYERPGWYFITEKLKSTPYDLNDLDSGYQQELAQRGVQVQYELDSMTRMRPASLRRGRRRDSGMDSTAQKQEVRRSGHLQEEDADRTGLKTRWIRVNPAGHLSVQATFEFPYNYLFGKLIGVLVVSFILLVLTIWCFAYMMNTILKQKKLSEIKNDFINNMTHELKTPIATVNAAIEALQHFQAIEDKDKTQSYLDISHQELERLTSLVERVLQDSIEGNGGFTLNWEQVDINLLVKELIERQGLKTAKTVYFNFQNKLPDNKILLDKLHFTNALNNIIDNAIKYSGEEVHIAITTELKANEYFCITIQDDGIGISPSYKKLIFDKFFRVPTGDLHEVKGFGLGLNYVQKVVEKHGGTIEVKSESGKGSSFIISIPQRAE